jgi:L-lactate dehydrogenase complex protein LldE
LFGFYRYTFCLCHFENKLAMAETSPLVGLFVTCAVDVMRPAVGHATAKLLEQAGCNLIVPEQGCCGQVGYNNGLPEDTAKLAEKVIATFEDMDYVVVPSGSCAGMLKKHYPTLFSDPKKTAAAERFANKVYELTEFLLDVLDVQPRTQDAFEGQVAYHDSCAGLRELYIRHQPRELSRRYRQCELEDVDAQSTCCGFGGTFCVKFPQISDQIVSEKADQVRQKNPNLLLGGDLTCLLNIAGKLQRQGINHIEVRHIAEFLAAETATPAIGQDR